MDVLTFSLTSNKQFLKTFIYRFLSPSYSFSLEENVIVGHQIGQVVAVDTDTQFNTVYYGIKTSITSSIFQISETNGTIYLARKVDREIKDLYVLTVQAYNKDKAGNISQKSSVEVKTLFSFLWSKGCVNWSEVGLPIDLQLIV